MRKIGYTLGAINLTDNQLARLNVYPTKREAMEKYGNMLEIAGDVNDFVKSLVPGIHGRLIYYRVLEDGSGERRYVPTSIFCRLLRKLL